MFVDISEYKVRKINHDIKTLDVKYTVNEVLNLLPDDVIINLHSSSYDIKLSHITRCSLIKRLEEDDCSSYKDLVVKDTGLYKDCTQQFNNIILTIEI